LETVPSARRVRIRQCRSEKASNARKASCRVSDSSTRLPACKGNAASAPDASQSTRVGFALMPGLRGERAQLIVLMVVEVHRLSIEVVVAVGSSRQTQALSPKGNVLLHI